MTSVSLVMVSGVSLHEAVPGQELLPDYRFSSWMCCARSPHRPLRDARMRTVAPSGPSTTYLVGPTPPAPLTQEIETSKVQDASAIAFKASTGSDRARQALRPGSTVSGRCAPAGPCPPAWWVGWSLATRPRAVRPREAPEDAPARGDCHRARLGDRKGPPLHVLAQAQRRPSVHSPDLRRALSGLPHPRAAVLQPRRPAVFGARHRAAGGGAGPAVAGQGDDEGRHRPRRARR
jgi:hypothetical protein